MALKNRSTRTAVALSLSLLILVSLLSNPSPALADGTGGASIPSFTDFSNVLSDGAPDLLRGLYARNILALPVVQQPSGSPGYVSNRNGEVTQFSLASQFGNVGLLAHNYLSGQSFSHLTVGQEIRLVYGGRRVEYFIVSEILRFQALRPNDPRSTFRDLETGEIWTADQLFRQVYGGSRHVTLQTCIEANGDLSWGRLFVIAVPKESLSRVGRQGR